MIRVRLFGLFRLDTGLRELKVDASKVRIVADLYPVLLEEAHKVNPRTKIIAKDIDGCIVVVNGKQLNKKVAIKDGDEVMLMSPVCGG